MTHFNARLACLAFLALFCAAPLAADLRVPIAESGDLVVAVPDGWTAQVERTGPDAPPTINLRPASGGAFHMLVTPIWAGNAGSKNLSREALHDAVRGAADRAKGQAVEPELPVVDFATPSSYGAYFSATDRAPEPDGFKNMMQGMVALARLRITFTVLVNGQPAPVVAQALQLLKSMRWQPNGAAAPSMQKKACYGDCAP
ncbi:MAG: hypothetical protein ABI624_10750 [Casimicrobiaceae bacterium]